MEPPMVRGSAGGAPGVGRRDGEGPGRRTWRGAEVAGAPAGGVETERGLAAERGEEPPGEEVVRAKAYFERGILENMMRQKEVREERRSKGKEEQIKIYLDLQMKKLDMEEAVKRRSIGIEEAAKLKKREIEATNVETKAKEVTLAFMSVEKNNMSSERKAWFANRRGRCLLATTSTR
ncbi:Receptor-like protein kinase HSL1 [Hordeum vulgare]|nr:Receptor-like protein kinase HSL1 [Hordeum vulgare]